MGSQVDPSFIQESDHRPKPTITKAGGIPLIDLSLLLTIRTPNRGDRIPEALKPLLTEVESACREWGFFQVINHGVPIDLLEGIQSAAKEFFALPIDEKRRVRREEENPLGYYDAEHTKNVRDWKEVFDFSVNEPMVVPATSEKGERRVVEVSNRWPEFPPYMRVLCIHQRGSHDMKYLRADRLELAMKRAKGNVNQCNEIFEAHIEVVYIIDLDQVETKIGARLVNELNHMVAATTAMYFNEPD